MISCLYDFSHCSSFLINAFCMLWRLQAATAIHAVLTALVFEVWIYLPTSISNRCFARCSNWGITFHRSFL